MEIFYLLMVGVRPSCGTYMGLVFQLGLRAGIKPGNGGAISLTQEFPSLSSHIRNLAPYGWQILLLACEWLHIIHRYLCAGEKTCFFFFAIEQNHMRWCFSLTPKISQSNRCFELAYMVADTSHARHRVQTLSIFRGQPLLVNWYVGQEHLEHLRLADVMLVASDWTVRWFHKKDVFPFSPSASPFTLNDLTQHINFLHLTIHTFTKAKQHLTSSFSVGDCFFTVLPLCQTDIWPFALKVVHILKKRPQKMGSTAAQHYDYKLL